MKLGRTRQSHPPRREDETPRDVPPHSLLYAARKEAVPVERRIHIRYTRCRVRVRVRARRAEEFIRRMVPECPRTRKGRMVN